jgi:hypothetical protein
MLIDVSSVTLVAGLIKGFTVGINFGALVYYEYVIEINVFKHFSISLIFFQSGAKDLQSFVSNNISFFLICLG